MLQLLKIRQLSRLQKSSIRKRGIMQRWLKKLDDTESLSNQAANDLSEKEKIIQEQEKLIEEKKRRVAVMH